MVFIKNINLNKSMYFVKKACLQFFLNKNINDCKYYLYFRTKVNIYYCFIKVYFYIIKNQYKTKYSIYFR